MEKLKNQIIKLQEDYFEDCRKIVMEANNSRLPININPIPIEVDAVKKDIVEYREKLAQLQGLHLGQTSNAKYLEKEIEKLESCLVGRVNIISQVSNQAKCYETLKYFSKISQNFPSMDLKLVREGDWMKFVKRNGFKNYNLTEYSGDISPELISKLSTFKATIRDNKLKSLGLNNFLMYINYLYNPNFEFIDIIRVGDIDKYKNKELIRFLKNYVEKNNHTLTIWTDKGNNYLQTNFNSLYLENIIDRELHDNIISKFGENTLTKIPLGIVFDNFHPYCSILVQKPRFFQLRSSFIPNKILYVHTPFGILVIGIEEY